MEAVQTNPLKLKRCKYLWLTMTRKKFFSSMLMRNMKKEFEAMEICQESK